MVYGRAGDEVLYLRKQGFESIVVPGLSSAIAGPTFAGIPVTQRGVAESLILCTGVGRQGKPVRLPGYVRSQTLVLLMGVARLESLLMTLGGTGDSGLLDGSPYPPHTPIAIIERASMPDQRVISATLSTILPALAHAGEHRPPGMIIIGWSILALHGEGDVSVLDDARQHGTEPTEKSHLENLDEKRVKVWLGDSLWRVTEGLGSWSEEGLFK